MSEKLYRLLELAKNTRDNFNLSKEELFIEYGKLVDEYETILKKFEQISLPPGTFSPGEKVEIEISAFSGLSHQFRTPLIFILTALEQMHTDSNNDEEKKKLFMMMIHAQRLFYIFKRVMALSDQGKEELQLNTGLYDIISFLKGIMASFFLLAQENKIELTLNTKENDISLYFDYEKMSEAISNILMSALRYTPAGGQIKISVQKLSPDILPYLTGIIHWINLLTIKKKVSVSDFIWLKSTYACTPVLFILIVLKVKVLKLPSKFLSKRKNLNTRKAKKLPDLPQAKFPLIKLPRAMPSCCV